MKRKLVYSLVTLMLIAVPFLASAQSVNIGLPGLGDINITGPGAGGGGGGWDPDNLRESGLPTGTIYGIVTNIMMWLLAIVGVVGIIGFAISGIMYIVSSGNDETMGKAKNAMLYSIIGITVALVGYVAIKAIDSMLRGSSVF